MSRVLSFTSSLAAATAAVLFALGLCLTCNVALADGNLAATVYCSCTRYTTTCKPNPSGCQPPMCEQFNCVLNPQQVIVCALNSCT